MSLFRKKPASQADRLAAFRLDSIPSREFTSELGDLLAELDLDVQREKSAFIATVGGRLLFLFWNDDDKVLSGWTELDDTRDAAELTTLLRRNLDPWPLWFALDDADEDSMGARFKLPFDGFDRAAALLALETAAGLLGDDAVAERARALRGAAAGEMEEQEANARTREALSAALQTLGAERQPSATASGRSRPRAAPCRRSRATPARASSSCTSSTYEEGTENVPMLRWLLVASDWSGARLGLAELPGGDGAFAACAVPALDLQPQARRLRARAGPAARRRLRRQDGARVSAEMVITIAFYALLVFGYFYAVGKIWRGESEFDGDDPPAFWPFSVELWRGAGRAMPVLGLGGLILIGAGIVSDLVGKDSPSYDLVMAIGTVGLLLTILVGFPIMYLNRPKLFVPPIWRDDPPIYPRRRAQGPADQRRRDRG